MKPDSKRKVYGLATMLVGIFGVVGCESLFQPDKLTNQEDAGSSYVSVLSIGPWSQYQADLQPHFTLSENDALTASIPVTEALQEQILQAVTAQLYSGAPVTSSSVTN
ncbi:MAG TPA: hypothetical protein VGN88_03510, partial [Phycisphaerae bacterium]